MLEKLKRLFSLNSGMSLNEDIQAVVELAYVAGFHNGMVYQELGCPDLPECKPDNEGRMNMVKSSGAILNYSRNLNKVIIK